MISTNKRKQLRVGTNLIVNISSKDSKNSIIFVENISAIGAKIKSVDRHLYIGEILNINFRYKNILYNISCKIVRKDSDSTYGVKFYFKDNSNNASNNENKLRHDILDEFFLNRRIC